MLGLIGFGIFYVKWIPYFELKITNLRSIIAEHELSTKMTHVKWTKEHEREWDFILKSILADPCLQRFDHRKRFYLRTDFCAKGFGYVGLQPTNDRVSLEAMKREMEGGECEFMKTDDPAGPSLRAV